MPPQPQREKTLAKEMLTIKMISEKTLGEASTPFISSMWPCISRVIMPRAYMLMILQSNSEKRR